MVQIIHLASFTHKSNSEFFISHMVQIIQSKLVTMTVMSVCFISHMVQIILKTKEYEQIGKKTYLYIPHGSDNTLSINLVLDITIGTLYPTWFR